MLLLLTKAIAVKKRKKKKKNEKEKNRVYSSLGMGGIGKKHLKSLSGNIADK